MSWYDHAAEHMELKWEIEKLTTKYARTGDSYLLDDIEFAGGKLALITAKISREYIEEQCEPIH